MCSGYEKAGLSMMSKKNKRINYFKRYWQLYLLLVLPVTYLIIFSYWPMLGAQIAFRSYRFDMGIWGSPWVGFQHFRTFFNSHQFTRLMFNTMTLSLYSMFAGFLPPVILALCINYCLRKHVGKTVQMVTFLPFFISNVLWMGMVTQFVSTNGLLNSFLLNFGIGPIQFLNRPEYFMHIFVVSGIVQNTGHGAIVYIAALVGVSPEMHEAAIMDGASLWKRIWYIDIPSILPTVVVLLILRTGSILSVGFEQVFLLQNPLNISRSDVIATHVYQLGLINMQFSYAAAIGLFQSVISLILVVIVNYVSQKVTNSSLF